MDQVFTMSRSSSTICSSHNFGAGANRRRSVSKSISLHWIVLIWLTALLPASYNYHAHGLDELHIGGIFPVRLISHFHLNLLKLILHAINLSKYFPHLFFFKFKSNPLIGLPTKIEMRPNRDRIL